MERENPLWRTDTNLIRHALSVAQKAATGDAAIQALRQYYTVESDYAGATFANLEPNDPYRITPTDLLATTMLSVDIPPITVRRLTGDTESAEQAAVLLKGLDPALGIASGEKHIDTMSSFYELIKGSLHQVGTDRSNAWVTASKICARKRPHLFPVRDSIIVKVLDLKGSYPDDWPVFSALMADEDLRDRIDRVVGEAASDGVDVGDTSMRLKHLDVLLWMRGKHGAGGKDST